MCELPFNYLYGLKKTSYKHPPGLKESIDKVPLLKTVQYDF